MSSAELFGWDRLRHGGLLLDMPRLRRVAENFPPPLSPYVERELRRLTNAALDDGANLVDFANFILEKVCGFTPANGSWQRGTQMGSEWGRRTVTGETVKPRQIWRGPNNALLPVFFDSEARIGTGRGRKAVSQTLQWLRAGSERLALLTNGRQWRLIFSGLDFDAWCEWDVDLWFEEGALSPQVEALRTLISPPQWLPPSTEAPAPLLQAILDSRKGQSELSAVLGERVREAVEHLVQAHGEVLKEHCAGVDPADIYRAAVRMVMRMVVVLFAESRELLPRDNALYHGAYGLTGLLAELEKAAARGGNRLARSWNAWPRVLALFRLVHQGSHHAALPVPAYGGELFDQGEASPADGVCRALAVFEGACFDRELMSDRDVHRVLERLTRTRVKLRQGRSNTWVPAPVDFSDLSSEYIGILYEGLLDFELKTAPSGDPVVFLSVGNQPALPLSRLEAMDDRALTNLLEKMKDTSNTEDESTEGKEAAAPAEEGAAADEIAGAEEEETEEPNVDEAADGVPDTGDERHATRTRAEVWARRAVEVGGLVRMPRRSMTPERRLAHEDSVARKARQLVAKVVLPGEWYLVRWGGTRKGSGTFYTRPGLAVPTVQRTLRPLAYDPPAGKGGQPERDAPPSSWSVKKPEEILALKVCDPACGSGTFAVAALRFLTESLYTSLHHHGRISADGERAILRLLDSSPQKESPEERLGQELLPCRPDEPLFEQRLKAVLRRHVVERCIYGVDLDPLAVELCRLSLWIETMDRNLPFSFLDHKIKCGNSLVGAWFDQFQHYPVMAWKHREGGDKNHTNGVHFKKDVRTKAIKSFVKDTLTADLRRFLGRDALFDKRDFQQEAALAHEEALAVLSRLHELPVQDSTERSRIYREELLGSAAYRSLKAAMDRWCACWFWPVNEIEHAPLPTTFSASPEETRRIAERVAQRLRFFHWELEFPDVFRAPGSGFDAMLGNPPWDIAKPNSKEFFSNIDPLYRSYGKQEALRYQVAYFGDQAVEREWLEYNADFRAQSNFMAHVASPFGDPQENENSGDRFLISRGGENDALHTRWRKARDKSRGFADPAHPFRNQGSADINLYKLSLEQAHALLRQGGRLGFIVPSGIYSDHGTGALRNLFLERCNWEWLFGFENRDKVFEIDSRFKFNPIIIHKGGKTESIRTAFMRRSLEDWERAESFVTHYTRAQVERFSPRSKAILEIQSSRDLEILEKIYSNSVLLGDDGPDGWGIKYAREFDMTNDSKLFPPRPKWEEQGYRPDEYSRWLKGNWRPIAELWTEMSIEPTRVVPIDPSCEDRLSGPGVYRSNWHLRCAQPPYDTLPIPRAEIPTGVSLSREADKWIREEQIEGMAFPFMQGAMLHQFDFSQKGWLSGTGLRARWEPISWACKVVSPQFLMDYKDAGGKIGRLSKVGFRRIARNTDARTLIASIVPRMPCGDVAPVLFVPSTLRTIVLPVVLNSFAIDCVVRLRVVGTHVDYHYVREAPILFPRIMEEDPKFAGIGLSLHGGAVGMAPEWLECLLLGKCGGLNGSRAWRHQWRSTEAIRLEGRALADALVFRFAGMNLMDLNHILLNCDMTATGREGQLDATGFWRVDKDKNPELRHTVLTFIAFRDLDEKILACGGDREKGIVAFHNQNDGEGWMLPETLRLADYGLGHDERAKEHQPVASRLGPRFYDWQLAQTPEESWRECHLHARNLLGEEGYRQLLADIEDEKRKEIPSKEFLAPSPPAPRSQMKLFH